MRRLQFWFEFASTYSYPAALRVEAAARDAAGVPVDWRTFLLGPIFRGQGWNDSPFNIYPVKGRYMWRDIERICAELGLPMCRAVGVPAQRPARRAGRVPLEEAEPWRREFVRADLPANFADDRDIADAGCRRGRPRELPVSRAEIIEAAQSRESKERLRAADRGRRAPRHLRRADLRGRRGALLGQRSPRASGRLVQRTVSSFESIVEARIRDAIARGDFDDLAGKGRRLALEDLSAVPEDLRAGYLLLKNAGVLPEEMQLRKEMVSLEALLDACADASERTRLRRDLHWKLIRFQVLMERRRSCARAQEYRGKLIAKIAR